MNDTGIIYRAHLNWIIFFWPAVLLAVSIYIALFEPMFHTPALIMFLIAGIWTIITWVQYLSSSLIIKKKQVILRTGVLVRNTLDIPLDKIASIDIRQSIFGSLLQYGSLVITGTGGTRQVITNLNSPLTCRRYIEQVMHQEP